MRTGHGGQSKGCTESRGGAESQNGSEGVKTQPGMSHHRKLVLFHVNRKCGKSFEHAEEQTH